MTYPIAEISVLLPDLEVVRRTENDVGNPCICQLSGASSSECLREKLGRSDNTPDLACEGTGGLGVAVLRRDFDVLAQKIEDGKQVQGRGGDDNLCGRICVMGMSGRGRA